MDNSSVPKTAIFGSGGKFQFLDRDEDRHEGGLGHPRNPFARPTVAVMPTPKKAFFLDNQYGL